MAGHLWWIAKKRSKHIRHRVEIEEPFPLDSLWTVIENGARALSTFRGGHSTQTRQTDELYLCKELILLWAEELRVRRENSRVRKSIYCFRKALYSLNYRRCLLRMEIAKMDEEVVRLETMPLTELENLEDKAIEQFTGLFEERITDIELNVYIDQIAAEEATSSSQPVPRDHGSVHRSESALRVSPQGDPPDRNCSKEMTCVSPRGDPLEKRSSKEMRRSSPQIDPTDIPSNNKQNQRASPYGDLPAKTSSKEVLSESHALLLKTSREMLKTTRGEEIFLADESSLSEKLVCVGGADPIHCYSTVSVGGNPMRCYSTINVEGDTAAKTQAFAEPASLFDFDGGVQKKSHEMVTCESAEDAKKMNCSPEKLLAVEMECSTDEILVQKSVCQNDEIESHIADLSLNRKMATCHCDDVEAQGQYCNVPSDKDLKTGKTSCESHQEFADISQEVGYLVKTLPDPEVVLGDALPESLYMECPELRWIANDRNSVGLTSFDDYDCDKDTTLTEDTTLTATDDTTISRSDTITITSELDDCTDTTEMNDEDEAFDYPDLRLDNLSIFSSKPYSTKSASPVEAFMHFMYGEEVSSRKMSREELPADPRSSLMVCQTGDELLPKMSIEDFTLKFPKDPRGPSIARESDTSICSAPETFNGGERLLETRLPFSHKDDLKRPEKKESLSASPTQPPKDGYPPKKVRPKTTIAIPGPHLEPHLPSTSCSGGSDSRVSSASKSGHDSRPRKDRHSRSLRRRLRLRNFFCFAFP